MESGRYGLYPRQKRQSILRAKAVIGKILGSGNETGKLFQGDYLRMRLEGGADALSKAGSKQQAKVTPVRELDLRRKGNAAGTFSIRC